MPPPNERKRKGTVKIACPRQGSDRLFARIDGVIERSPCGGGGANANHAIFGVEGQLVGGRN